MRSPGCSISEDVMCLAIQLAFHMQLLPEVRGREEEEREGKAGENLYKLDNVGKRWGKREKKSGEREVEIE